MAGSVAKRVGSPPQVRGKQFRRSKIALRKRITPAGAGKTKNGRQAVQRPQDHPRGCGENCYSLQPKRSGLGSPPRMRGKLAATLSDTESPRITPADAGKTETVKGIPAAEEDHPRGCGENCSSCRDFHGVPGSPPRMRGKPGRNGAKQQAYRITPADAGKTASKKGVTKNI